MLQHKTTVLSTFNRNMSVDLVAGVPLPGLLGYGGPEVRGARVGDGRGEPQQPPGQLLPVRAGLPLRVGRL